jgi:hypothetical protein
MSIVDRYRSVTYGTELDAHAAAQTLEDFGLHPLGPFELRAVTVRDGGVMVTWEVVCVIPEKSAERDPFDLVDDDFVTLDEVVDYIESQRDREADDRDINRRRRTRDEY